ncbi:MAG: iron ABC transporter permease [Pseudomonadota bacterium]
MTHASGRLSLFLSSGLIAIPVLAAIWFGLTGGDGQAWDHILNNRLVPYTLTTLGALFLTGLLVLVIAIPLAWLISAYEFPGRAIFEWALILPLAMPGYVMAYAWADLTGVSGPLQASLREMTGLSARDYWFPDVFSLPGLAFVMAATLYPYIYLTARSAFTTQSLSTLEAARSLGAHGAHLFLSIAMPAARPAIVAGLALALMETAADYGAADFLGIQTLGVGLVRAWTSFGEPATAARLSIGLISIAFLFMILERTQRGQMGVQQTSSRWKTLARRPLATAQGWSASLLCIIVLAIVFITPMARLVWLAWDHGVDAERLAGPLASSMILGVAGMLAAFVLALPIALASANRRRLAWIGRLTAASGYAAPGVVLGLGGLFILGALGLPLTGSYALFILVWIYASRFSTIGAEPMIAAQMRAPRSLGEATRSLGVRGIWRLWRVDLPILLPGILAGGLILFVETLKELPATLMLRPFGWDTLAVRAHAYASDERLAEATLPSVLITLAGLVPVILLSRQMTASGERS